MATSQLSDYLFSIPFSSHTLIRQQRMCVISSLGILFSMLQHTPFIPLDEFVFAHRIAPESSSSIIDSLKLLLYLIGNRLTLLNPLD